MDDSHKTAGDHQDSHNLDYKLSPDTEELLTIRLVSKSFKYILAIITFFGVLLGYVGINIRDDLNETKRKFEDEVGSAVELVESLTNEIDSLRKVTAEKEFYLDILQGSIELNQQVFNRNLIALGSQSEKITRSITDSQELSTRMKSTLASIVDSVRLMKNRFNKIDNKIDSMQDELNKFRAKVEDMETELFNAGTYVAKEKSETELYGLNLMIRMATIRNERLRQLEIIEIGSRKILWGPEDLKLGVTYKIPYGKKTIQIVPRYIIELFRGKDIAGIDVRLYENVKKAN